MTRRYKLALARDCLALALFIIGFLGPQAVWAGAEKEGNAEAVVAALAEEYWTKRLVEKDYAFTYEKELQKESMSFEDYVEQVRPGQKFKFLSVKTKKVNIDGDRGEVYLDVKLSAAFMPKQDTMMLQDLWLFSSGEWKHQFTTR